MCVPLGFFENTWAISITVFKHRQLYEIEVVLSNVCSHEIRILECSLIGYCELSDVLCTKINTILVHIANLLINVFLQENTRQ